MKLLALVTTTVLLSAGSAWANDAKPADKAAVVDKAAAAVTGKPSRKKKAEMCSECGKPESECECHGKDKKHDHKKDDGHGH